MIEIVQETKWNDGVLVKIPTIKDAFGVNKIQYVDTGCVRESKIFKQIQKKDLEYNLRYGRLRLIYDQDFDHNFDFSNITSKSDNANILHNFEDESKDIGFVIDIILPSGCIYATIKKSVLDSLDLKEDWTALVFESCFSSKFVYMDPIVVTLIKNRRKKCYIKKEDVKKCLEAGYKIGRTDWDGFWLEKRGALIYMISINGQAIDSSKISITSVTDELSDNYRYFICEDKDDSITTGINIREMDFSTAIEMVKLGFYVRRTSWGYYDYIKPIASDENTLIKVKGDPFTTCAYYENYTPSIDDVLAVDWVCR